MFTLRMMSLSILIVAVCGSVTARAAHEDEAISQTPSATGQAVDQTQNGFHLTYQNRSDSQIVTFNGMLPQTIEVGLSRLRESLIPGKPIDLVVSSSMGGIVSTYRQLASTLREACPKGSCQITTYADDICASACIDLFMVGDLRVVSSHVIFGFHRAFKGFGPFERVTQTKEQFVQTYVDLGADRRWLEANVDQLTANQKRATWVRAADLIDGGFADRIDSAGDFVRRRRASLPGEFSVLHYLVDRPQMLQSAAH